MIDNTEDRPNTYLEEARKFKAAQENANALEVQKLINMLDAASESVRKHEAMLVRLRTEIAYINEALGCLGETVPVSLGEPMNASMVVDGEVTRETKVVEGPLPEHPPMTLVEQSKAARREADLARLPAEAFQQEMEDLVRDIVNRNVRPGTTMPVFDLRRAVWAYASNQDAHNALTSWLSKQPKNQLNGMVRLALAELRERKIVRMHKNDRVGLARKR